MILADGDHTGDIVVATIGALAVVIVAVLPLWWADLRSRRKAHDALAGLHEKSDELLRVTNSIHDEEQVADNDLTLGQLVRDGFKRNDETHQQIIGTLGEHTKAISANQRGIARNEATLRAHDHRISDNETAIEERHPPPIPKMRGKDDRA